MGEAEEGRPRTTSPPASSGKLNVNTALATFCTTTNYTQLEIRASTAIDLFELWHIHFLCLFLATRRPPSSNVGVRATESPDTHPNISKPHRLLIPLHEKLEYLVESVIRHEHSIYTVRISELVLPKGHRLGSAS